MGCFMSSKVNYEKWGARIVGRMYRYFTISWLVHRVVCFVQECFAVFRIARIVSCWFTSPGSSGQFVCGIIRAFGAFSDVRRSSTLASSPNQFTGLIVSEFFVVSVDCSAFSDFFGLVEDVEWLVGESIRWCLIHFGTVWSFYPLLTG